MLIMVIAGWNLNNFQKDIDFVIYFYDFLAH